MLVFETDKFDPKVGWRLVLTELGTELIKEIKIREIKLWRMVCITGMPSLKIGMEQYIKTRRNCTS